MIHYKLLILLFSFIAHRRTTSSITSDGTVHYSLIRVRLLYYWTRTRIVHVMIPCSFPLFQFWCQTSRQKACFYCNCCTSEMRNFFTA